jgi:hypothetical protein
VYKGQTSLTVFPRIKSLTPFTVLPYSWKLMFLPSLANSNSFIYLRNQFLRNFSYSPLLPLLTLISTHELPFLRTLCHPLSCLVVVYHCLPHCISFIKCSALRNNILIHLMSLNQKWHWFVTFSKRGKYLHLECTVISMQNHTQCGPLKDILVQFKVVEHWNKIWINTFYLRFLFHVTGFLFFYLTFHKFLMVLTIFFQS